MKAAPVGRWRRWRWVLLAFVLMTALASTAAGAALLYAPRRTAPDVQVASLSLKGLAWEEAALRLGMASRSALVTWELEGAAIDVPVRLELDVQATLARVFALGRSGDLWQRLADWRKLEPGHVIEGVWRVADGELVKVSAAVGPLAHLDPVDAVLRHQGDSVWVEPDRQGRGVDEGALAAQLSALGAGQSRFAVPVKPVAPALSTADVEGWGVSVLRGKMTTFYDAANLTRTNNILVASRAVQAVLLAPGETFSFNDRVGQRTVERGYQVAHVILADALVPGLGGGICQVSSTIYAAGVMAGMTVVERSNHSLPIWYMEPAMDATVSWEGPDLILRNDTGQHLLMTVSLDQEGASTVRIFGPPGGGAKLESVVGNRFAPPVQTVVDPALAPGEEVVDQPGQEGFTASLYRVSNGERTLVNTSYYLAHPRRVRVGPAPQPTTEPPPGEESLPEPEVPQGPDTGEHAG